MLNKNLFKASEISTLIKNKLENFKNYDIIRNEGKIVSLSDGIVKIYGLQDAQYGEKLSFENGAAGILLCNHLKHINPVQETTPDKNLTYYDFKLASNFIRYDKEVIL